MSGKLKVKGNVMKGKEPAVKAPVETKSLTRADSYQNGAHPGEGQGAIEAVNSSGSKTEEDMSICLKSSHP